MIITLLVITPLIGIFIIILQLSYGLPNINKIIKINALLISIVELALSLMAWLLFDINGPHFQFVQEQFTINNYNFYLGIDGLSIYFILLTTFMIPISILSN
jgi:NADH:ubiquinone oxidoreductase subunit 4 (subunit M)